MKRSGGGFFSQKIYFKLNNGTFYHLSSSPINFPIMCHQLFTDFFNIYFALYGTSLSTSYCTHLIVCNFYAM